MTDGHRRSGGHAIRRPVGQRYVVAKVGELRPGDRKIIEVGNRSIGVFNVHGQFYALRNSCPHQGAPLCIGPVTGTTFAVKPYQQTFEREGEIVRCPWHSWEFDITTGRSVFNPHATRVKSFEVTAGKPDPDDIYLETFDVTIEGEFVILHA